MSVVQKWRFRTDFGSIAQGVTLHSSTRGSLAFSPKLSANASPFKSHFKRPDPPFGAKSNWGWHSLVSEMQTGLENIFGGRRSPPDIRSYFGRPPTREPEPTPPSQWYKLADTCLLALHKGDITKWLVDGKNDAIVNAANKWMLGGGGVDGAIHDAAGKELYYACKQVPQVAPGVRCPTGEARITPGFRLPTSAVIHTVGPIYESKEESEPLLVASYRNSILLAAEKGLHYLAFPAVSCGVYGYPYDEGAMTALSTCKEHADKLKEIHFVLFDQPAWGAWRAAARELALPLIEIDEDARKAVQQRALEERRAKQSRGDEEGSPRMRGHRSPEGTAPRDVGLRGIWGRKPEKQPPGRGFWRAGGRAESEEGVARFGADSFEEERYRAGLGGGMTGLGGTRKEGSRGGAGKEEGMQDGFSAWGGAWEVGSGWGAPWAEKEGGEKEDRAPGWLADAEEGSEMEGGNGQGDKQEANQGGMKKVTSSSGSFRTGKEDFEGEDSQEEGTDGNVLKRVRSEDEYKDAHEEVDLSERRSKKTGDAPAGGSIEASEGEKDADTKKS